MVLGGAWRCPVCCGGAHCGSSDFFTSTFTHNESGTQLVMLLWMLLRRERPMAAASCGG